MTGFTVLSLLLAASVPAGSAPAAPSATAVPAPVPLVVDVRARALEPGEPVRVAVSAAEPLAELRGKFLDAELFFVREAGSGAETWTAWSAIPLDRKPGAARLSVEGVTAAGAPAASARTLSVRAKRFPTERLNVKESYVEPPPEVQDRIAREQALMKAVYARRSAPVAGPARFVAPVQGKASGVFGSRRIFNGKPRAPHAGVDLAAATGTPVKAAGPAVVAYSGDLYFAGETVVLDHGGGLFTIYAHLSERRVAEGDSVAAGEVLGLSGATGRVTGPHLHWGGRVGEHVVDPRALLDGRLFPP